MKLLKRKLIWIPLLVLFVLASILGGLGKIAYSISPAKIAEFACLKHHGTTLVFDERDDKVYTVCADCFRLLSFVHAKECEGKPLHYIVNKNLKVPLLAQINTVPYLNPTLVRIIEEDRKERLQPTVIFNEVKE